MTKNDKHEHHERNENDACNEHPHEGHRGKYPRPVGDLFTNPYMPGMVQAVFENPVTEGLEDATEQDKFPDQWPGQLKKVLQKNKGTWKPSFPLLYPWSKRSPKDVDRAREFYIKSERGKFVTFHFPPEADVVQIAAELKNIAGIERAKPVAKVVPPGINDPLFGESDQPQTFAGGLENQWYAFRCKLRQALEQVDGRGVVVAVIDWGFDVSHPDYSEGITLKWNVKYLNDRVGNGNAIHHGTGALGLAGARINNSEGMVGFAPDANLWAIQAGEDDEFDPEYWKRAIDFVREEDSLHRKVIILEVQTAFRGNIESNDVINQAIRDAIAADIIVCVPAGNGSGNAGEDEQGKQIQETGSVLVGATTVQDVAIGKTGDRITVYAPGDPEHDLTCTSLPDRYTNYFGGTSGAVAKVGGAVALLLDADNSLTPAEVKRILGESEIRVLATSTGPAIPNKGLLDCGYAVYSCMARKQSEGVLTKYSAMV
jgi:subtilisin family serine protease